MLTTVQGFLLPFWPLRSRWLSGLNARDVMFIYLATSGYQSGGLPRNVNCPGTDPLGGAIGGDTAAVLPGLKLGDLFIICTCVEDAHL